MVALLSTNEGNNALQGSHRQRGVPQQDILQHVTQADHRGEIQISEPAARCRNVSPGKEQPVARDVVGAQGACLTRCLSLCCKMLYCLVPLTDSSKMMVQIYII